VACEPIIDGQSVPDDETRARSAKPQDGRGDFFGPAQPSDWLRAQDFLHGFGFLGEHFRSGYRLSYFKAAMPKLINVRSASDARFDPGVGMASAWGKRGDFHRQPVAPSIFAISDFSDLVPQFAISVTVEHTCRCANLPFSDTDGNLGITPDILDPSRRFTCLGK
jgi:hypothetical protein